MCLIKKRFTFKTTNNWQVNNSTKPILQTPHKFFLVAAVLKIFHQNKCFLKVTYFIGKNTKNCFLWLKQRNKDLKMLWRHMYCDTVWQQWYIILYRFKKILKSHHFNTIVIFLSILMTIKPCLSLSVLFLFLFQLQIVQKQCCQILRIFMWCHTYSFFVYYTNMH